MTLFLAMLLDAAAGEPRWLWDRVPHPAVIMGKLVGWADEMFNTPGMGRAKGVVTLLGLILVALVLGLILRAIPGQIIDLIVLAILLAQRSLSDHVRAVANGLRDSLTAGRAAVAMIVGRDTAEMTEPDVARAAIESAAENLSDGVIAPIFWFVVAGLPGLLIYKIVNTADSMIGYRTPRHRDFGWAAARCDDLLNLIPARLTALLILIATMRLDVWEGVMDDAPLHRSPNAGWPEAAAAYALNVALSGPRTYDGTRVDYPFVNSNGIHDLGPTHVDEVVMLLWKTWGLTLATAALGVLAWWIT